MELSVVELFAGVGGFRVGLNKIKDFNVENGRANENGDWKFVWANQYEPSTKLQHAYECYATRFGKEDVSNLDINKVDKTTIPNHSLLVGGFPCQDYSVARSLNGERGIEGKKGVLFWDIKDILKAKKSSFVLLENVDRLLKSPASKRGRDFAVMLRTFYDLGYDVQWRVINPANYSMPQKRRRVFIFAYKNNINYASTFQIDNSLDKTIFNIIFPVKLKTIEYKSIKKYKDVLDISDNFTDGKFLECGLMVNGDIVTADVEPIESEDTYMLKKIIKEADEYISDDLSPYLITDEKLDKWKYLKGAKKINRTSKSGHQYIYSEGSMSFPDKMESIARTMLTSEGTLNRSSHIIFDEKIQKYRILTEVECELIQMFPPNWTNTMPSRRRYFMMGNALVTGVISKLEPMLKKIIENTEYDIKE